MFGPSCHRISWKHSLFGLLVKIIQLGSSNLYYLSKEKNCGVILMGVFPHLKVSRFCLSGMTLSSSFSCNVVGSGNKMWHRRLGHLNSDVLHTLFNSGLLGNKACSSIDLSFDCTSCKLCKSKVLPFPHHASRASQCF